MAEWRLYPDRAVPPVSTYAFHQARQRAPHLEQADHRDRLIEAARLVEVSAGMVTQDDAIRRVFPSKRPIGAVNVSDLGCGDGGLLSLLGTSPLVWSAWGYDFQPSNQSGWAERGVAAEQLDAFDPANRDKVSLGDVVVLTEVLEHLADPHGVLAWLASSPQVEAVVASCPWAENDQTHDECHAWAWDLAGFQELFTSAGLVPQFHYTAGMSQFMVAIPQSRFRERSHEW